MSSILRLGLVYFKSWNWVIDLMAVASVIAVFCLFFGAAINVSEVLVLLLACPLVACSVWNF